MKREAVRLLLALGLFSASIAPLAAEEAPKATLPTLLIKGEIVTLDTSDPASSLLKVKDRYGFETPIYVTKETKITQNDQAVELADLKSGEMVEVEYSFDINTAKRHAANIRRTPAGATAAATGAAAAQAAPEAAAATPAVTDAAASTPAADSAQPAATPAASEQPAVPAQ